MDRKGKGFCIFVGRNIEKSGVFKQPKVFQFDNRPVFKRDVTKLTGKHNTGAQRATAKYTTLT